jgi:Fic family protein
MIGSERILYSNKITMINFDLPYNELPLLPPQENLETLSVFKALNKASRALGSLKGIDALSDTKISLLVMEPLLVPESVSSNEIEWIHTTIKEFFDAEMDKKKMIWNNKEVQNYRNALLRWFKQIKEHEFLIVNDIMKIQEILEPNKPGIRSSPGKKIMNSLTGQTLYVPPQWQQLLLDLMGNLEKYINDDSLSPVDPLIKMAIIHYQFESIHPFLDGNWRTWRILMILYLVLKWLLDFPMLYLSGYINKHKADYYRLLHEIRIKNTWEEYVIYMLQGIEQQAEHTTQQLIDINTLINQIKEKVKNISWIKYNDEFVLWLFEQPSFTLTWLEASTSIHRHTLRKYTWLLEEQWVLRKLDPEKKTHVAYTVIWFREILQRV